MRCVRAEEVRVQAAPVPAAPTTSPLPHAGEPVLALRGVRAGYGDLTVVHDMNLELSPRECLALVGESGSGKTTLARSIAGLHRERTGEILLRGDGARASSPGRPREARRDIQYIFQNPYGSLNPRRTVGQIVRQPLDVFGGVDNPDAQVDQMLERVALSAGYADRYPDQLSGGERQRVAIARALVSGPSVLVCDEVTSALDVSVQAAIVELLAELQRDLGLAMLFVTHNLPLVRSIAGRVAVMSLGRIVELGGSSRSSTPRPTSTRSACSPTRRRSRPQRRDRHRGPPAQRAAPDGRPAGRRLASRLRPRRHARPAPDGAGARGRDLRAAYCASPLCAPVPLGHAGRPPCPSATGVFDNAAEWAASTPTVMHALRAAGYATASPARCTSSGPTSCTASRSA